MASRGEVPEGLMIDYDYVTEKQEAAILAELDIQEWSNKLSRRTQHYGYEYDYKTKKALKLAQPLTGWIELIAEDLFEQGVFSAKPEQCLVNEYVRSQGISAHTDSPIFGETVVSLSLGGEAMMIFTRGTERFSLYLPRRSIVCLTGEARTQWKHEIPTSVKLIRPDGTQFIQPAMYRRVSLTYRNLV